MPDSVWLVLMAITGIGAYCNLGDAWLAWRRRHGK